MKLFNYWCILMFSIFSMSMLTAQTQLINGKIADAETSIGIAYSNIYIKGSQVGTVTNLSGEFEIYVPDSLSQDSLVISSIGYHPYILYLDTLQLTDSLYIQLNPNPYSLDQILMLSEDINSRDIVRQAIDRINKNYAKKPHSIEAFFRELNFQDDVYQRLIEAAVLINDPGIRKDPERIKVRVQELRKSEDYRNQSFVQRAFNFVAGVKYNSLLSLIKWDPVRHHMQMTDKPWHTSQAWLRKSFPDRFEFELVDILKEGENEYFKIEYKEPDSVFEKHAFVMIGSILINRQDYGIKEYEFYYKNNPLVNKTSIGVGEDKFLFNLHAAYKKYGEKYFLDRLQLHSTGVGPLPFNFDVKRENGEVVGGIRGKSFLLQVNNIITDKKQIDKIRRKEAERKDIDLYSKDFEYNEAFWSAYNAIPLDSKYISAQKYLEKEKTLEEQFKNQ